MESESDTNHFFRLPMELQSEIISYCPRWPLLTSVSLTCKRFREICLRIFFREMDVCYYFNDFFFNMLELYPELASAVRHITLHAPETLSNTLYANFLGPPDTESMASCNAQLVSALSRHSFSSLRRLDVEYYICHTDYFIELINTVSEFQPKMLGTLIIKVRDGGNSMEESVSKGITQEGVVWPKKLRCVGIGFEATVERVSWDPFAVLEASAETITTLELNLNHWEDHFNSSSMVYPTLKVLKIGQDRWDAKSIAEQLSVIFPNVEELWLDPDNSGSLAQGEARSRETLDKMIERYKPYNAFRKVKRVEMKYSEDMSTVPEDAMAHYDYVVPLVAGLIKGWVMSGMRELEWVNCPRYKELEGIYLDFKFRVIKWGGGDDVQNISVVGWT